MPRKANVVEIDKKSVLIVDDTLENLEVLKSILSDEYVVRIATSGRIALKIAFSAKPPDLILLDVMMPEMDGYEVCRQIKADVRTQHIPIIFVTAKSEIDDETNGFLLGAADYITKPISPPIVLARIKTHLALKASADFLRDQNDYLEAEVNRRVEQIDNIQDIFGKVVDPRIRDYLLQTSARLSGDVTEGAVMFCDIRHFTAYAESRDPRQVIEFLNAFFSEAASCVEKEGGFINKYLGDAFMAVFGTPFELDNFRASALRAARCIRDIVQKINAAHPDEPPFAIAMGIHAGPMVAGIVGSASRMEFTTIGDTVNIASRMEGLCREYGVEVMVSAAMLENVPDAPITRSLGTTTLRGRQQGIEIFTF